MHVCMAQVLAKTFVSSRGALQVNLPVRARKRVLEVWTVLRLLLI